MQKPFAMTRLLSGMIAVIMLSSLWPRPLDLFEGEPEEALVAPTFAVHDSQAGVYRIHAHVWVYEPDPDSKIRQMLVRELRDEVGVPIGTPEAKLFERRVRRFMVDNERHEKVVVRLAENNVELGRTAANGHVQGTVTFPAKGKPAKRLKLRYSVDDDEVVVEQSVPVLSEKGLSVVSDIDDTIKDSNVLDHEKLLKNTFAKEFAAVPKMAAAYRALAKKGASFHYLSSSPWQLFEPLEEFRREKGFPEGTFHLRVYRPKSIGSNLDLVGDSQPYKLRNLRRLLGELAKRDFILIGDAGEHDPEIYGTIAREYPGRVRAIYIRKVEGADLSTERFDRAFRELDIPTVTFDDPKAIPSP